VDLFVKLNLVLFLGSASLLCYIYFGYPLLIWTLARLFPKPVKKGAYTEPFSIIIVAYNEAENLRRKIPDILQASNASQIAEIFIASDGSTDETVSLAESFADQRIKVLDYPVRRGKPSVLNETIPLCSSDIVVLMDARQRVHEDAFVELLSNFCDPEVGVVSAELIFNVNNEDSGAHGITHYWSYEKMIRKSESLFSSVPGATGACYALRKKLFEPIPANVLVDDVVIPMTIILQGYRCLLEEKAKIFDEISRSMKHEFIRKRRTLTGNLQMLHLFPAWLSPLQNPIWGSFFSHKVLRLASPLCLATIFVSNLMLCCFGCLSGIYLIVLVAQICLYSIGVLGYISDILCCNNRLFVGVTMFVSINVETIFALINSIFGKYTVTWDTGKSKDIENHVK